MGNEARAGRLRQLPMSTAQGEPSVGEIHDPLAFERRLEVARIRRAINLEARATGRSRGGERTGLELASEVPALHALPEFRTLRAPEGRNIGRNRAAVIGRIFALGLALGVGAAAVVALSTGGSERLPDTPPPAIATLVPARLDLPLSRAVSLPMPSEPLHASPEMPVHLAAMTREAATPSVLTHGWRIDTGIAPGQYAGVDVHLSVPPSLSDEEIAVAEARLLDAGFEDVVAARADVSIGRTNVRFFAGADAAAADAAAAALSGDWPGAESRDFTHLAARTEPGRLEIWLSGSAPPRSGSSRPAAAAAGPERPQTPGLAEFLGRVLGGASESPRRESESGIHTTRATRSVRPATVSVAPRISASGSGPSRAGAVASGPDTEVASGRARGNGGRDPGGSGTATSTGNGGSGGATAGGRDQGVSTGSGTVSETGGATTVSRPDSAADNEGAGRSNQGRTASLGGGSRAAGVSSSGQDNKAGGSRSGQRGGGWDRGGGGSSKAGGNGRSKSAGQRSSKGGGNGVSRGGGRETSRGGGNGRSNGKGDRKDRSGSGGKNGRNR